MSLVPVAITHAKVLSVSSDGDESKAQGHDWNDPHNINPPLFLEIIGILVVSGDPNGIPNPDGPGGPRALAWDQTNGQLWTNTDGNVAWTPFIRADGGTALPKIAIAFLGDSQFTSQGVNTDNMSRAPNVFVPNEKVVLDKIYAPSSSEPIPVVDNGRGFLRVVNVGAAPGFGPELSFGREIFDLLNGFGTEETQSNKPWLISFAISGVELKQLLPASTYGLATPAFGGRNAYGAWKAMVDAALAASGRRLGLLIGDLGPNDGSNLTAANEVAANWVTFANQVAIDYPGCQIMMVLMHPDADAAFNPAIVRAQQLLAASQIPGCSTVDYKDLPLLSDNLHLGARRVWTLGGRTAARARDQLGLVSRKTTIPAVRGYGEPEYSNTIIGALTLKPCAYPMTQDGDISLLVVGSLKLSGSYVTIPAPTVPATGWVQLGNSSQSGGGFSGETQGFALFMRPVSQTDIDTNPNGVIPPGSQILLSNDENYAKLFTLFGPSRFLVVDGSIVPFSATSFSDLPTVAPGVTTTSPNSLVVICFVTQGGGSSPLEHYTVSNQNLDNLTVISDEPYALATSDFGVLVFAAGTMVTPGPTGPTTITPTSGFAQAPCGFTVAFKAA